ncbi:hypothetical protein TIFTF001_028334 [Ficus carica]|uniref:Uncharacterized protein n=1 Tax=Ficus carica TaxID=3494 RepID=A0AA88DPT3_FICCA|nr:hypothetical protein TIFTF001_028334 [Ficus carica]
MHYAVPGIDFINIGPETGVWFELHTHLIFGCDDPWMPKILQTGNELVEVLWLVLVSANNILRTRYWIVQNGKELVKSL